MHASGQQGHGSLIFYTIGELQMPIKPLFLPTDLARARQILGSWTSLERLSSDDADIIARMIAQGIGEGRSHGLELAETEQPVRK
jgi:hypothetical protein